MKPQKKKKKKNLVKLISGSLTLFIIKMNVLFYFYY